MVHIQSATCEITRGKKEETGRKYVCPHPTMQAGHEKYTTAETAILFMQNILQLKIVMP